MCAPMSNDNTEKETLLIAEIQQLIVDALELEDVQPEDIRPDMPLFSEDGLGLDSIDAMELGVALKRRYQVTLNQETQDVDKHFANVAALARFVANNQ